MQDKTSSPLLRNAKRIVVKVGSSLVTNEGRGLDAEAIGQWCEQLAALANDGREVIMVSSGAVAEGDALVILTDQKGLYSADPRKDPAAQFVHEAKAGDAALEAMAGGAGSSIGKGGMITKILAAKRAAGSGASTVIAWGREPQA